MFQKCFRKTLKYGPVDWEARTRKSRPTIWRKFSQHLSCCINPIHYRFSFSQPYLAMKHLQKKQGVGVAKEPRRNIKILGLRLHYRFGNHVLQIPSNYFHSSAFHKRFSLQNAASFAWDDHNAVYHSPLYFRNLVQKILVLKGHPQGL